MEEGKLLDFNLTRKWPILILKVKPGNKVSDLLWDHFGVINSNYNKKTNVYNIN